MTTDIPKALILLPGHSIGDAPPCYGLIEISHSRGAGFFDMLREHVRHAAAIGKASASPPIRFDNEHFAQPLYRYLSGHSGWCDFLRQVPEDSNFEESFHGVDDIETLLQHTAEDLMAPHEEVHALLDDGEGGGRPVIIDFAKWHENCRVGGFFTDSLEAFWVTLQEHMVNTEADELVIELPWRMPVTRYTANQYGKQIEFGPFEHKIEFFFNSNVKHSDTEKLETRRIEILPFVSAFEDAVKTVRAR